MHINLLDIKDKMIIDSDFSFSKEDLDKAGIIELKNGKVKGYINSDLFTSLKITGEMVLPCSVTLKPVNYPFECQIADDLATILEEIGEKMENTIDILPIIWENILMEIPLKVVSDEITDMKLQGDGWKLIQDEKEITNPELEKLQDLL